MDWDDARFFLAAARAGQLSAAARRLGVDHATVGRRISALEAELGARLLERRPTGCVPTRAGERFLDVAERMESEWLRAQGEFAEGQIEMTGAVRIGGFSAIGLYLTLLGGLVWVTAAVWQLLVARGLIKPQGK